jgi:hypothetical protein
MGEESNLQLLSCFSFSGTSAMEKSFARSIRRESINNVGERPRMDMVPSSRVVTGTARPTGTGSLLIAPVRTNHRRDFAVEQNHTLSPTGTRGESTNRDFFQAVACTRTRNAPSKLGMIPILNGPPQKESSTSHRNSNERSSVKDGCI